MRIDRGLRKTIVKKARKLVIKVTGQKQTHNLCLPLAWSVCTVARKLNVRLQMFAGTTYWPRVTPETDDGVESNVFGYKWEPNSEITLNRIERRLLPEMHVWAGDPFDGLIIDLTTGFWPTQCHDVTGMDWKALDPPDYFWGYPSELPKLASYESNLEAGQVALSILLQETEAHFVEGNNDEN